VRRNDDSFEGIGCVKSLHIAVIGAGAAGLVTARELQRAGFRVTIFEQTATVAGVWAYTPETEADPLGQRGERIHSSLYASLRTNLPRDLMAYTDYPFDTAGGGHDDWPRFPGHACVREYLERFARDSGVLAYVRLNARVARIQPDARDGWSLLVIAGASEQRLRFDAVAVCSGHYSAPRVPHLAGAGEFPGEQLHSHNYREPSRYRDRRVALLGTAASGLDLSREIATVAAEVYWCGALFDELADAARSAGKLRRMPGIEALQPDGRLRLRDGTVTEPVDALIYCTGYLYRYPFIAPSLISVDDNWVQPLYRDILHVDYRTLAFIGIPFRVVPFPLFEMQARWFARLLDGAFALPSSSALRADTAASIEALRASGVKQRHFHQRSIDCFPYLDALADECGIAPAPDWQRLLAAAFLAQVEQFAGDVRERPLPHFGPTTVPDDSILS
jgi:cation diffusion facilitator CzcD-associated flavoprotein CzcO